MQADMVYALIEIGEWSLRHAHHQSRIVVTTSATLLNCVIAASGLNPKLAIDLIMLAGSKKPRSRLSTASHQVIGFLEDVIGEGIKHTPYAGWPWVDDPDKEVNLEDIEPH